MSVIRIDPLELSPEDLGTLRTVYTDWKNCIHANIGFDVVTIEDHPELGVFLQDGGSDEEIRRYLRDEGVYWECPEVEYFRIYRKTYVFPHHKGARYCSSSELAKIRVFMPLIQDESFLVSSCFSFRAFNPCYLMGPRRNIWGDRY